MTRSTVFFLSAFTLGLLACGQNGAVSTASAQDVTEAQAVVSNSWRVISEKSHIKFTAEQGGKPFTGEFDMFEAKIDFDPENLASASVVVTIPLAQVDADDSDRNSTLKSKAWFSSKKFPEAVFKSSDFSTLEDGRFLAKGDLSIKDISVPLEFPFSLEIGEEAIMTAQLPIDRTAWNIGEDPKTSKDWTSQQISRDVLLDIQVTATR